MNVYIKQPNAETVCAITVATAAPATPILNTAINKISNIIFKIVENIKNTSGERESPTLLKNEQIKL